MTSWPSAALDFPKENCAKRHFPREIPRLVPTSIQIYRYINMYLYMPKYAKYRRMAKKLLYQSRLRKTTRPKRGRRPIATGRKSGTLINPLIGKTLLPRRLITTCTLATSGFFKLAGAGGRTQTFYNLVINGNDPQFPLLRTITVLGDNDILTLNSTSTTANIQPAGFNTLVGANQFYNNFRVYALSVAVNALPQGSTDDLYLCMAPLAEPVPGLYGDPSQMTSLGLSRGPQPIQYYATTAKKELKAFWRIQQIVGLSKQAIMDNPAFAGSSAASPTNLVTIQCMIYTMTGANFAVAPMIQVRIKYFLELYNQNEAGIPI